MKKTVENKNKIKKAIITAISIAQLGIVGCGNDNWIPTSHIVFVDYTTSCNALDDINRENVKKRILTIAESLRMEDQLVVYPIHAYTQSASPIVTIKPPVLRGDLRDSQRKKEWKNMLAPEIEKVINFVFSDEALAGTNVFATMRKANRSLKNGVNIKLYFISDMIHEFRDLSFKNVFPNMNESDMISLALDKANTYCPNQTLKDVNVEIYLPGRPEGNPQYTEDLYHTVNCFWEEFFSNAGTSVKIRELKV